MSPQAKDRVMEWLIKAAIILVPVGIAWGSLTSAVSRKLDAERFVTDSVNHSRTLDEIQRGVNEANARLREMQCGVPARPACR